MPDANFPTVTDTLDITLGCDPQIVLTITEKSNGTLTFEINAPEGADIDIDGFFFDLTEDSTAEALDIYPAVNTDIVTGFSATANSENSLSNGAQTLEPYDVMLQFGTVADSTEGAVGDAEFVVQTNDGSPLTLADIDLESFAAVINSDGIGGQVLLVNDEEEQPSDECEFTIEGDVNVGVTLTELDNGEIEVTLNVLDPSEGGTGEVGDLRGFFFNIADESLLDGLSVSGADVTDSEFDADSVRNLGNGANMQGGGRSGYDGGVEIGHQGIGGGDDIQQTTFVLSHPDGLSLEDFSNQSIGIRLTSTGSEDGGREGSLKLEGECPEVPPMDCEDQYPLVNVLNLMTPPTPELFPEVSSAMDIFADAEAAVI